MVQLDLNVPSPFGISYVMQKQPSKNPKLDGGRLLPSIQEKSVPKKRGAARALAKPAIVNLMSGDTSLSSFGGYNRQPKLNFAATGKSQTKSDRDYMILENQKNRIMRMQFGNNAAAAAE